MNFKTVLQGLFGVSAYLYFFYSLPFAATIFMINGSEHVSELDSVFPYNIDYNYENSDMATGWKVVINILLLGAFAIPHSFFARSQVKKYMNLPKEIERSFYVLQAAGLLHMLLALWRPIPDEIWRTGTPGSIPILVVYFLGAAWLVSSTFAIDHFELFGLRQSLRMGSFLKMNSDTNFVTKFHYKLVRHPIMTGFFIMLWAVPEMSAGHLLFSLACSAYILLAVFLLEERDLMKMFGDDYKNYKKETPAFCPFMNKCYPSPQVEN